MKNKIVIIWFFFVSMAGTLMIAQMFCDTFNHQDIYEDKAFFLFSIILGLFIYITGILDHFGILFRKREK